MVNLAAFVNYFLEYLIVFLVFGVAIVVAFLIGMNIRKAKNNKEASEAGMAKPSLTEADK